jgi:hypothetical protein
LTWRTGAYQRQRVGERDYRGGADGRGPAGGIAPNFTNWRYRRELSIYLDTASRQPYSSWCLRGLISLVAGVTVNLPIRSFQASGPRYRRVVRDARNAEPATCRTMNT